MARRASYLPLSHDDYEIARVRRTVRRYGGGPDLLAQPGVLARAQDLLLAGEPVQIVAKDVGYSWLPGFYKAWERLGRAPPLEWLASQVDGGSAKLEEIHADPD